MIVPIEEQTKEKVTNFFRLVKLYNCYAIKFGYRTMVRGAYWAI